MHSHTQSIHGRIKGARRRLRILLLIVICFLVWAGVTLMDQMHVLDQKTMRLQNLEQERAKALSINEQYELEINRLNDPEYIEQRLRKDLHMTKEGEILFIPVE